MIQQHAGARDGAGPPRSVDRDRPQTTLQRINPQWGLREASREKAVSNRQVWTREMSANEPLMTRRNLFNWRPKVSNHATHDEFGGHLFLAKRHPTLRWHEPSLGLCAELGNHHSDAKGEIQVGPTHENQSTNAEEWTEQPVVAMKFL